MGVLAFFAQVVVVGIERALLRIIRREIVAFLSSVSNRNFLYSYEQLIVIARSEIPRTVTLSFPIIGHCEKRSDEAIYERTRDRLRNLIKNGSE